MLIKKSNCLIELASNFTRWELMLLDRALSGINEDLSFRVDVPKIGTESKYHVSVVCEKISHKIVTVYTKKDVLHIPLFEKIGVIRGQLTGIFNYNLKDLLVDLTGDFTLISLDETEKFRSKYTLRIYQMLIMSKFRGKKIDFDIETFVQAIGYPSIDRVFYSRIVQPSCSEISEKTEYSVAFKKIKNGKFTIGIEFYIHKKALDQRENIHEIILEILSKKPAGNVLGDRFYLKSLGYDVYFDQKEKIWKNEKVIDIKKQKMATEKQKFAIKNLAGYPVDFNGMTSKQASDLIRKLNEEKKAG
jgi:plasmid replication initiation protein